uniref:Uncharacterized protein n=1 Tax=viral metagenome TaxID=1070528 RepID=A0A6C0HTC7_9ZZZZ
MFEDTFPIYTNDQEYREMVRQVCSMKQHQIVTLDQIQIDEVTHDEWDYDNDAMSQWLNTVYDLTGKDPLFQELYRIAAGTMLSEDLQIGLAIMISYDYFQDFYHCLQLFSKKSSILRTLRSEQSGVEYQERVQKLQQKIRGQK